MTRDSYDLFTPPERGRFGDNEADGREGPPQQRVSGASDLIDVAMVKHWQTHPDNPERGAILVSSDGDENHAVWVPTKFCEIERKGGDVAGTKKNGQRVQLEAVTLTLPQWVAKQKGLI
jgi:hypothetical protein